MVSIYFGHTSDTCVNRFVKLLTATPSQVLSLIVGPERRELEAQMTGLEKDDDSESCFIQGALDDLKVRPYAICFNVGYK